MEKTNKILDNIRKCIEKETLSFIIGAGFSKNISQNFPLWKDLLTPLMLELYPECNTRDKTIKESKINQLIAEKTYLGIASEYVRRKGYHEAIDIYIEHHMPYLSLRENGEYDLMMNGNVIDSNPSIECHKKLLALNAKHIFTFNYDNTLDILADVEASSRLLNQLNQATERALFYQDLLEKYKIEYIKLSINITDVEYTSSTASPNKTIDYTRINKIIDDASLDLIPYSDSISDYQKLYESHINTFNTEIAIQNNIAQNTKSQREGKYQQITDAYQISLTDTCKNIYKLHGNLRIGGVPYGFDGDKHMQYVITKEDYDNYPKKHDAFVSLMRISLLKGCLCLIGFSGDDPNFLAWIDWVKDILDGSNSKQQRTSAIYYINADSKNLDASKELLLQNHYIEVVNLHKCFPEASTPQQRISLFLDSLSRDKEFYDVYNESWGKINVDRGSLHKIYSLSVDIEKVYVLSKYNKIPSQFGIAHYRRYNALSQATQILNANIDPNLRAKLIYSAIVGELIPIDAVLSPKQINRLSQEITELDDSYKHLIAMSKILNGEILENTPEDDVYELGLSHLFNLRFDEAKRFIDTWSPKQGIDKMRRYLLLSVYDGDMDIKGVTNLINPDNFSCLQEYQYALDILPKIRGLATTKKGGGITMYGDLQSQIDYISKHNPHLIKVGEQIDKLLNEMNKSSSQPFGNVKNTINFGSYNIALVNATKVLQILVELGIPTKARFILLLDKDKWLKVCEILYERYPQPCLYFSLLYGNNKDILRRIAQCYIYSIRLKEVQPKLLIMMLKALSNESCPLNVTEAIYIVAPIFMKAVNAEDWIDDFEKVYEKLDIGALCDDRMSVNEIQEFIITGVTLSNSERFKHKVLLQTLRLGNKISDIHNRLIIAASNGIDINDLEKEQLNYLCECAETPNQIYVLMNMSKWIGKDKIVQKLQVLADDIYKDCTLLEAACEYSKENTTLQSKLKNIIFNSSLLWQTGIDDNCSSVSHYGHTLGIYDIQQFVKFNHEEIFVIYTKLKSAFDKIDIITKKWKERRIWSSFNDWSYILVEMQNFLKTNRITLCKDTNYSTTLRAITRLLNQGRGGNSISSLLIDDEKTGKAISMLVNDIHRLGIGSYHYEYMLIANKILARQSKYLNSCFIHFGWALTKYKDGFDKVAIKPLLKSILELYKQYFEGRNELNWDLEYAEKDIVERELCKIYKVYQSWGGQISFWDNYIPRYYY